jgi:hypothetical protein
MHRQMCARTRSGSRSCVGRTVTCMDCPVPAETPAARAFAERGGPGRGAGLECPIDRTMEPLHPRASR